MKWTWLLLLAACSSGGPAPTPDAGQWWEPGLAECHPRGAAPRTVFQVVERLNALPPDAGVACFVASLPRPISAVATLSTFSAQPADGRSSPRVFVLNDQLILSIVPSGAGAQLLEMGELVEPGRTLKGELLLPMALPIAPDAPLTHVLRGPYATSCALCHRGEVPHATVDAGFVSAAFRPNPGELVPISDLKDEVARCDPAKERARCELLIALFGFGAVQQGKFPGNFELFVQ